MPRLTVSLVVACCLVLPAPLAVGQEKGKKHALLVGVTEYDHASLARLRYTENDIEGLASLLGRPGAGFASVRVLTTSRGKRRKADAPNGENIRAAIKALLARKKRDDTVLVALAGHGIQAKVKDSDESFFCPSDAQLNDNGTLISVGSLMKDLGGCGAGVKLLLVDACRNDPSLGRNVDIDTLPRPPRGLAALFSCKGGERAFESPKLGRGHGVFFFHVLEGLKGKAATEDKEVTWDSLSAYVRRAVSRQVPTLIGGGARQTPHAITNIEGEPPVLLKVGKSVAGGSPSPVQPPKPQPPKRTSPLSATGGGYQITGDRSGTVTATKDGKLYWKIDLTKAVGGGGGATATFHGLDIYQNAVICARGPTLSSWELTTGKQRWVTRVPVGSGDTVKLSVEDGKIFLTVAGKKIAFRVADGKLSK
jgi:hypothetical protein